jgi:hypothetical protein
MNSVCENVKHTSNVSQSKSSTFIISSPVSTGSLKKKIITPARKKKKVSIMNTKLSPIQAKQIQEIF